METDLIDELNELNILAQSCPDRNDHLQPKVDILDKIRGMFAAAFLGDALGAPHEFRCNRGQHYTGKLEYHPFRMSQFQGRTELRVGQITDDSEMTLALLRTLVRDGDFYEPNVVRSYYDWVNSGTKCLGTNTRELFLFKAQDPIKGYRFRLAKKTQQSENAISQSNGSLMRASPFALFPCPTAVEYEGSQYDTDSPFKYYDNPLFADCCITNPNNVNMDVSASYVYLLHYLLQLPTEASLNLCDVIANTYPIQTNSVNRLYAEFLQDSEVLTTAKLQHDMSLGKGHCVHGLYATWMILSRCNSFTEAANWIINRNYNPILIDARHPTPSVAVPELTDTDTNALIGLAAYGAMVGFKQLMECPITCENWRILRATNTTIGVADNLRPAAYCLDDFDDLMFRAYHLYKCLHDVQEIYDIM